MDGLVGIYELISTPDSTGYLGRRKMTRFPGVYNIADANEGFRKEQMQGLFTKFLQGVAYGLLQPRKVLGRLQLPSYSSNCVFFPYLGTMYKLLCNVMVTFRY
jgi:hypothetical protein